MNQFKKAPFQHKLSAAETRFNFLTRRLRKIRDFTKQTQTDIAWMVKEMQDYGFNFFPNHYLWENLNKIEKILADYDKGLV